MTMLVADKALEDILDESALWQDIGAIVQRVALPIFREIYMGGVLAGIRLARRAGYKAEDELDEAIETILDPTFTARSAMFLTAYTNEWWQTLRASTRRSLLDAILEARERGDSVLDVKKKIEPLFGKERASRIAVTETTRLFGRGAQEAYRGMNVEMWDWRTAEDGRVDPDCDQMAAGSPYPMSQFFSPLHVNCRCWPVPHAP